MEKKYLSCSSFLNKTKRISSSMNDLISALKINCAVSTETKAPLAVAQQRDGIPQAGPSTEFWKLPAALAWASSATNFVDNLEKMGDFYCNLGMAELENMNHKEALLLLEAALLKITLATKKSDTSSQEFERVTDKVFKINALIKKVEQLNNELKEGNQEDKQVKENQPSTNPESKRLSERRAVLEKNRGDYDEEFAKLVRQMMHKADECRKKIIETTMESIIGYAELKEEVHASLIFPREYRAALENSITVSCATSVLFFGAQRGVKAMLAFALANKLNYSMISLSSLDILDDNVREYTSKMKAAFAAAVKKGPCVLFLDQIESFLQDRWKSETLSDLVRLQFYEFKTQCDNLKTHNERNPKQEVILVLGTNNPKKLDVAVWQRVELYFHVHFPREEERKLFLQHKLGDDVTREFSSKEWFCILANTIGYSFRHIGHLITAVNCFRISRYQTANFFKKIQDKWTPCSEKEEGAVRLTVEDIDPADGVLEKIAAWHVILCAERKPPIWDVDDENGPIKACERFSKRFQNVGCREFTKSSSSNAPVKDCTANEKTNCTANEKESFERWNGIYGADKKQNCILV